MGKWADKVVFKNYMTNVPVPAALGRAGFAQGEPVVYPRAKLKPPPELVNRAIPSVRKWQRIISDIAQHRTE